MAQSINLNRTAIHQDNLKGYKILHLITILYTCLHHLKLQTTLPCDITKLACVILIIITQQTSTDAYE